jgi:hypothetical protein
MAAGNITAAQRKALLLKKSRCLPGTINLSTSKQHENSDFSGAPFDHRDRDFPSRELTKYFLFLTEERIEEKPFVTLAAVPTNTCCQL